MSRPAWTALGAALLLSGCASFSDDAGLGRVGEYTRARIGQAAEWQRTPESQAQARERSAALLAQPLTPEAAVALALLNNRDLQARLAELGIAEAELVQAGRLRNPSLSFGRMRMGDGVEIDRALGFDLLGLLTLPLTRQLAEGRMAQAQLQAAIDVVGLAADTRRAYFEAVAARQVEGHYALAQEAAEAASVLGQRMAAAGNYHRLEQLREQAFYADAIAQRARAQHQAVATRERLARLLGLSGSGLDFRLPDRLPDLPATPQAPRDAVQQALDQRLDVALARQSAEVTARALGLSRATRVVNVLHTSYTNQSATGEPRSNGYEVELQLPLFDFGQARVAGAEARYRQAMDRVAQIGLQAQSEVREAHSAYRTAYELARHYRDEVVPLRKRISEENLLRYNGMFASVFELLADAREQILGVNLAIEAQRDFWLAENQLQLALTGRSPGAVTPLSPVRAGSAAAARPH